MKPSLLGLGWFFGFLAFSLVFFVGASLPGQFGGLVAGIGLASAVLALEDWKVPDFSYGFRIVWRALVQDPRLPQFWRRIRPPT